MDRKEEFKEQVLKYVKGEINYSDDGFKYYWPDTGGYLCAEALRIIADELDRQNAGLEKSIKNYFDAHKIEPDSGAFDA